MFHSKKIKRKIETTEIWIESGESNQYNLEEFCGSSMILCVVEFHEEAPSHTAMKANVNSVLLCYDAMISAKATQNHCEQKLQYKCPLLSDIDSKVPDDRK